MQIPFIPNVNKLSTNEVSIIFNISFSHVNINLVNRHVLHDQLSISKYSSVLDALPHSQ